MEKSKFLDALLYRDREQRKRIEQFWSDPTSEILGLKVDHNGQVQSMFKIENLERYFRSVRSEQVSGIRDIIVVKGSNGPEVIRWVTDQEAADHIRALFAKNAAGQLPILDLYEQILRFVDRPEVLQSLTEERSTLMSGILEWSDNLLDLESSTNPMQESETGLDRIATKIILLKNREQQLTKMLNSSSEVFSDLILHSSYRTTLHETVEMLRSESIQLFDLWQRESNSAIEIGVLNKPCIVFQDEMPSITLTDAMISTVVGSEKLAAYELNVDRDSPIARLRANITPLLKQVETLKGVVEFYSRITDEIFPCHAALLIVAARNFTELLESVQTNPVSWNYGPDKIRSWIGTLQSSMNSLVEQNSNIQKCHKEIVDILLKSLNEADSTPNTQLWIKVQLPASLGKLRIENEAIKLRYPRSRDTLAWRKHIDYQLYKIIRFALLSAAHRKSAKTTQKLKFHDRESEKFVVNLELNPQGILVFEPSIEKIKLELVKNLNSMISLPAKISGLVDWKEAEFPNNRTLFHVFYLSPKSEKLLYKFYSRIEKVSKELTKLKHPFQIWSSLYLLIQRIKSDLYEGKYENQDSVKILQLQGLQEFRQVLEEIRAMNQQFLAKYEIVNELQCDSWSELLVNIVPIKMLVKWLVGESKSVILQILSRQITVQLEKIEKICTESLKKLEAIPDSIPELVEFDQYLSSVLPKIHADLRVDIVGLRERVRFAQSYQQSTPGEQRVNVLLQKFEESFVRSQDMKAEVLQHLRKLSNEEKTKLENDVGDFLDRWARLGDLLKSAPEVVSSFETNAEELTSRIGPLRDALFHLEPKRTAKLLSNIDDFSAVREEIQKLNGKYGVLREFEATLAPFLDTEWIVARSKLSSIEAQLEEWSLKHQQRQGSEVVLSYIDSWRDFIAAVQVCRGENYFAQHWSMLLAILDIENRPSEQIKTQDLFRKREALSNSQDQIKELNKLAVRDQYIEETFRELDQIDENSRFVLGNFLTKDGKSVQIIKDWQEAMNILADSSLLVQSLQGLAQDTKEATRKRIEEWENRISILQTLLMSLNRVQRKWISLEPIFAQTSSSSTDGFSAEREIFSRNSADFQRLIRQITLENRARILGLNSVDNRLEARLDGLEKQFSLIQKRLRNLMESARQRFPRFYFLSDEDLLLILSGKVDLNESGLIQKLFANTISKLVYQESRIVALESVQGEVIRLRNPVNLPKETNSSAIEAGLIQLSSEIERTIREIYQEYSTSINDINTRLWREIPSQLLSVFSWLDFTSRIEYAISRNSLLDVKSEYEKHLGGFTTRKPQEYSDEKTKNLQEMKLRQIVLDLIHFLQVIEKLQEKNVTNTEDWIWQRELRFYAQNSGVQIRMGVSSIDYSFSHYLGALGDQKLVHTDLTDRCFLTMTQAVALGLGANPYGPAGTGKTETVKALGVHLGREVLVFNCDEAIDTRSMVRILLGIIQCGAWACFDEFNRLQLDVLSVLSTLIGTLQDALKTGKTKVNLPPGLAEVSSVSVNPSSAIFITLNPAGKQYGARNELPVNLKALFLPVAMTVPDSQDIIGFLLLAQGFSRPVATSLASKIRIFFEFASGCLSKQRHYDWGLRAMKACVLAAGRQLQPGMSEKEQFRIVVHAFEEQIQPKLVEEDQRSFEGLLRSAFRNDLGKAPPTNIPKEIIEKAIEELELFKDDELIKRVLELNTQLHSRLGVVLVGPTGSGKTTVWTVLKRSLELKGPENAIKTAIISAKSIVPKTRLFGQIEQETRDWIDGVFTSRARELTSQTQQRVWLILDGEIDPEWVEALNSVLDDNRVLTLASGERINFDPSFCSIIFECPSLKNASPATISRLGVICLPPRAQILEFIFKTPNETVKNILENSSITQESVHRLISNLRTLKSCENQFNLEALYDELTNPKPDDLGTYSPYDDFEGAQQLGNRIVETQSIAELKGRVQAIGETEDFIGIVVSGPTNCGKWSLLDSLVFNRSTSTVIVFHSMPTSDAQSVVRLLLQTGSLKRTRQGGQSLHFGSDTSWLVVKNLELLERDKWGGNSLEALLLFLVCHRGFYHYETLEWIEVKNLNLVITCSDPCFIDARLQSRLHHLRMAAPTLQDIGKILASRAQNNEREDLSQKFPKRFLQFVDLLRASSGSLNFLAIGLHALQNLQAFDSVDDEILDREIARIFKEYSTKPDDIEILKQATPFSEKILFPESAEEFRYREMIPEDVEKEIAKNIKNSELFNGQDNTMAITNLTTEIYLNILAFLRHENSIEEFDVRGLILIGNRGFCREIITRLLGEALGYQIWTPKNAQNERQFLNEMKQILASDQGESSGSSKNILLFIDQTHLECIDFLERHILALLRPNQIIRSSKKEFDSGFLSSMASIHLRVVITRDELSVVDQLKWLRSNVILSIHDVPQACDYEKIAQKILPQELAQEFATQLYGIFQHFTLKALTYRKDVRTNLFHYRSYAATFSKKVQEFRSKMRNEMQRLELGVSSLDRVGEAVRELKNETFEKKTQLDAKRKEADEAFEMIVGSMQNSEDKRDELEKLQVKIAAETKQLKERKSKVDEELAAIEPLLEQAKQSVGSIKNESLSEIRSLRAPPTVIRDILEGVLRLLGVKDTSWNSMKNYLSRKGIAQIINFDPSQVSQQALDQVDQLLQSRGASFEPANAKRASIAASSLAEWVTANVRYGQVIRKVQPFQKELEKLESQLSSAQTRLKTLGLQMEGVDTQVQALRERMQQLTVEAAQIEINLTESNKTLSASETLVGQLSQEHGRWRKKLATIQHDLAEVGLKLSLSVAYCLFAPIVQSQNERKVLWDSALERFAPEVEAFAPEELFEKNELQAFLSLHSPETVVLVHDPHHKVLESLEGCFEKTRLNAKDALRQLELAQRLGRTLVVENCQPRQFHDAKLLELMFGNRERHQDYRILFLTDDIESFDSHPSLLTVTRQIQLGGSFETVVEALLSRMIQVAAPKLEYEMAETKKTIREQKIQLQQLENELLESFADPDRNGSSIVQDEKLIARLRKLKEGSANIEESMRQSTRILEQDLQVRAAKYRRTAELAGRLFQTIETLPTFTPVYHFDFTEFEHLFQRILMDHLDANENIDDSQLVQSIFDHVSRGLFPHHQRAWAKMIGQQFSEMYPTIPKQDIGIFLKNFLEKRGGCALIVTAKGENVLTDINRVVAPSSIIHVSLGAQSIQNAESLFRQSSNAQKTVCLTNLHLVSNWLSTLAQLLTIQRQFSVLLITEMCDHIPKTLLEQCEKFAHHSTSGSRPPIVKTGNLEERLELFHWIVTERRLYVPIGWSQYYEFGSSEKMFAQQMYELVTRKVGKDDAMLDWIIGLLSNVIYGGKMNQNHDQRILKLILNRCLKRTGTSRRDNDLQELALPANIGRVRTRVTQEELAKNLNLLLRAQNQQNQSDKLSSKFGIEYFRPLWVKILQKCKIVIRDDNSLELPILENSSQNDSFSIEQVYRGELDTCCRLIRAIHSSFFQNNPPKEFVESLQLNQTPSIWLDSHWAYGSETAQQFLIDVARIYRKLTSNETTTLKLDLNTSFDPCVVFKRLQQFAAQKLGLSLDELDFDCVWNDRKPNLDEGVKVLLTGISVEGAQYDLEANTLSPVDSVDSPVISAMPDLQLIFDRRDSFATKYRKSQVSLPLFVNSSRQTLIFDSIQVPADAALHNRLVEMGVALVLGIFN